MITLLFLAAVRRLFQSVVVLWVLVARLETVMSSVQPEVMWKRHKPMLLWLRQLVSPSVRLKGRLHMSGVMSMVAVRPVMWVLTILSQKKVLIKVPMHISKAVVLALLRSLAVRFITMCLVPARVNQVSMSVRKPW